MGHKQLTLEMRKILERLLAQGRSIRYAADVLGYSASAICQEVARNSVYQHDKRVYQCEAAQKRADYRKKRHKILTYKSNAVVSYVEKKLKEYWSPEQIHGRLMVDYPSEKCMRISFKTVYRWIARSAAGRSPLGRKARYTKYLRLKRQRKYVRHGTTNSMGSRRLPCISKRTDVATKKVEFGHWEGDLVLGFRGAENAVTLVDMSTGFLVATSCKNKKMETVNEAVMRALGNLPRNLIKTVTFDRGSEFSAYEEIEQSLDCQVYFCHPQAPNERALNEQTNGLLRQFYPKRKRSVFSDPDRLAWAVGLINNRPRKKFGYRTTWEIIEEQGLAEVLSLV